MRLFKVFLFYEINIESLLYGVIGLFLVGFYNWNDLVGLVVV